jgi:pimeloyl-ACP methyl ester carboxylesterase
VVVGWSFGASVALREALDDGRVSALALVGIPLRPGDVEMPPLPDRTDLRLFARPAMLLAGEHDRYAPPEDLRAYGALFPQAEVVVVPGTDHYFWRREREAASVVGAFADRVLNRA